jgi:hypothetical protein
MVGELRAGLPKVTGQILKKSDRKISAVGSEYLNFQFGIMPTVSDVSTLLTLASNPELRKAVKHVLGEEHRVRKTLINDSSNVTEESYDYNSILGSYSRDIRLTKTTSKSERVWSSVSFVYYQASLLDQLLVDLEKELGNFGTIPKLIDAWNLTAWSWFVDWFVNFNHVITNLSYLGRDGLMLQRGYLMAHHRMTITSRQTRVFMGTPIESIGIETYERKYRVNASPFGFGLTWRDFSPFQTSILASLGVSKLRF